MSDEKSLPPAPPVDRVGPWRSERGGPDGVQRWSPVGTRSSGVLGQVDPAGLVGPAGAGWSLDWWIGAEDRWYLPAREAAVRQSVVDDSPVVETRQRVPGGDIVHRVFAAQGDTSLDNRETIVVEIVNETPVPVAVAVSLRPYGVAAGDDEAVALTVDADGTIDIDGVWTLLADHLPRRTAVGDRETDCLALVTRGEASAADGADAGVGPGGSVAHIHPLPHSANLRFALVPGPAPDDPVAAVEALPTAEAVASGWSRQADHGLSMVLPDAQMAAAFATARQRLLLAASGMAGLDAGTDQALLARTLSELGHHDELRPQVGALLEQQSLTGTIADQRGSEAATGAALVTLGRWWRLDPRTELLEELVGPLAKAAHRIERRRMVRKHRKDPRKAGLLPAGPQPVELGLPAMTYLDDWWAAAGQLEIAPLLAAGGQHEASVDAERFGRGLLADVLRSVDAVGPTLNDEAVPAGPDRTLDEGIVSVLVGAGPLDVLDGDHPAVARTVDLVRKELTHDDGWVRAGVASPAASPWLTACLALHEIRRGDARGVDRLAWMLRVGGGAVSWPQWIDERGIGGGRGDDPVAGALFLAAVRSLLVVERPATPTLDASMAADDVGALDILPVFPPDWVGSGVEAHEVPTSFGRFGFAVRWHGERPALLWELEPVAHTPACRITASALAPGWSTDEPVGETLLPAPAGLEVPMMNEETTDVDNDASAVMLDPEADGDVSFS